MDNNNISYKNVERSQKGFMKMYVNNTLYNVFEGRTSLVESIIINLEFIIVGLVDGMIK